MPPVNDISSQFSRIASCINVPRLLNSRVVVGGLGGSADSIVDLARQGVGNFVLFDFDHVSKENLATQGFTWTDIGDLKIEAVARRIRSINPNASITLIPKKIQELSDKEMAVILRESESNTSSATVLAAYTDDFFAQATMNRLAVKFRVPMIAAQIWDRGLTAEIIFTCPDITWACARCILWDRYEAFRTGRGVRGNSKGTPVTTVSLLNSNCTELTLGLLHAGTDNQRFGHMIAALANRNFIPVKCDPSCPEPVFDSEQFHYPKRYGWTGTATLAFPGRPECPDCHGDGACGGPCDWITDSREIFPTT